MEENYTRLHVGGGYANDEFVAFCFKMLNSHMACSTIKTADVLQSEFSKRH